MKRLILSMAVLSLAATACKKNVNDKTFSARGTVAGNIVGTAVLPLKIEEDTFLSQDTLYILDGKCYVTNNATLIVQEGTTIQAVKKSTNDSSSALIVTRGAKLFAVGTSTSPIVFTSNEVNPAPGDWGGIVLLGNAPLNRPDTTIEGINLPSVPPGVDVNYGGGGSLGVDPHHSAGELQYVRIEYAGAAILPDNELNGLTCGGVGDGTILDFIEVAYGNDDAFEFFGGTVNAKHLFAFVPDDDAFDFDFGYNGQIQFAVSVLDPSENYSSNPNGIESDNDATGSGNTPRTKATISNMTVCGLQTNALADADGLLHGAHLRRNSSFIIKNSIFMGFNNGMFLQSTGSVGDAANISYNLIHGHDAASNVSPLGSNNQLYVGGTDANDNIQLAAPWNILSPDFRPLSTSPALSEPVDFSGLSGFFTAVSYRGAFGAHNADPSINNWLAGWAKYNY